MGRSRSLPRFPLTWVLLTASMPGLAACLPTGAMLGLSAMSSLIGGSEPGLGFDQPYDDRAERFADAADQARAQAAQRVRPGCEQQAAQMAEEAGTTTTTKPAEACGIRPICLPGAAQPMMLMVCEER